MELPEAEFIQQRLSTSDSCLCLPEVPRAKHFGHFLYCRLRWCPFPLVFSQNSSRVSKRPSDSSVSLLQQSSAVALFPATPLNHCWCFSLGNSSLLLLTRDFSELPLLTRCLSLCPRTRQLSND